tara:strand:+ start:1528 stop:1680 length:153 start_codon:yes stop_codon:yes gene_type:complete
MRVKPSAGLVGVAVGAFAAAATSLPIGIVVILAFGAAMYFKLMKALKRAQ